jgi:hypothetical protein
LLRSRIQQAISPVGLEPTVGLMEFEWVQPMDRPPFELSTHGGHLRKLAATTQQPAELTEWLAGSHFGFMRAIFTSSWDQPRAEEPYLFEC